MKEQKKREIRRSGGTNGLRRRLLNGLRHRRSSRRDGGGSGGRSSVMSDFLGLLLHELLSSVHLAFIHHRNQLLLMRFHGEVDTDLLDGDGLDVTSISDELINSKDQIENVVDDGLLLDALGEFGDGFGEGSKSFDILNDV